MPAPQRSKRTRINLDVMKSQIMRKLGPDRAKGYFDSLSRLLGLKMSEGDFHKLCRSNFGRDFVPLHNKFVRSILLNACAPKVPPPRGAAKGKGNAVVLSASACKSAVANEKGANLPVQQSGRNSVQQPAVSDGNVPSASLCKSMSGGRDGRNEDRPSNGKKTGVAPRQSSAAEGETVSRERGFLRPCDLKRSQLPQQSVLEGPLAKRPRTGVTTVPDKVPVQSKLFELARGWTGDKTTFSSNPGLRPVQQNGLAEPSAKKLSTGEALVQDYVPVHSKLVDLPREATRDKAGINSSPFDIRGSMQQQKQNGSAEPAMRPCTGDVAAHAENSAQQQKQNESAEPATRLCTGAVAAHAANSAQQQKQNGSAEPATRLCTGAVAAQPANSAQQQKQNGPAEPASTGGVAAHAENSVQQQNQDGPAELSAPAKGRVSMHTSPIEVPAAVDEEVPGDKTAFDARRRPILAPFGISFSDGSVGGTFGSLNTAGGFSGCYDSGELSDTYALRNHMEGIAKAQNMDEVTMASANALNQGLDCYLKRLISACVLCQGAIKQQPYAKPVNGVLPGSLEVENELTRQQPVSIHDFKVAMEINPRLLGNDWPRLLEKICFRASEE